MSNRRVIDRLSEISSSLTKNTNKSEIFIVNLYDYLSENTDNSMICNEYQKHNKFIINDLYPELGFEFKCIDITKEQEDYLKSNTGVFDLSPKHKYQLISDYVRYEYLSNNPGSIFIDTDFVIFNRLGLVRLNELRSLSIKDGLDYTAGEIGRHGLHPCNWLMISSGGSNSLSKKLINLYVDRLSKSSISEWKLNNPKTESESELEYERRLVFDLAWGYKLYEFINPNEYEMIPYQEWQCSFWNGDWKDTDVLRKDKILGCHFFGFAKGRPKINEFLNYHGLDNLILSEDEIKSVTNLSLSSMIDNWDSYVYRNPNTPLDDPQKRYIKLTEDNKSELNKNKITKLKELISMEDLVINNGFGNYIPNSSIKIPNKLINISNEGIPVELNEDKGFYVILDTDNKFKLIYNLGPTSSAVDESSSSSWYLVASDLEIR